MEVTIVEAGFFMVCLGLTFFLFALAVSVFVRGHNEVIVIKRDKK